ncbi:LLM class flavin-dependent oxidoreductase [Gryllotalpicola sp.]|uniref:LLM class flavin-dependent oxidoreductase n=1 Tax=Gryllotalpicola sp. TaxID=1932787 RepID=UPI002608D5AA|nr:LLM class flavin-dependent oxidoreductase [Gryllotalpicola sp.]
MTFRLGFQTHLHGEQSAADLYAGGIDLFQAAEELGFETGWVAQHHLSTNEGRLPSPLVFLAAVAQRTSRIRLGTAVVTITLDEPLRVAEDAAVLDALASGRLELGIGSGNPHPEQFAAFGRSADDRRALYANASDVLRRALAGEELAPGTRLQPPAPTLLERIWESPGSVEREAQVARDGHGVLIGIGPAATVQLELAQAYLAAAAEVGIAPRLAIVHSAFFGASAEAVADSLWPGVRDSSLSYYQRAGWVGEDAAPEELLAAMNIHHGTVDDVIASVGAEPVVELATDLVFAAQAHRTTFDEAIRGLETIAREVAPVLGWKRAAAEVGA